jgi:hypothetical protein
MWGGVSLARLLSTKSARFRVHYDVREARWHKEGSQMHDTGEYARDRYRELVARGLVHARLERARATEESGASAPRAGRARRAVATWLIAFGTRLAASTEPGKSQSHREPLRP